MTRSDAGAAIIERVEQVRQQAGLNKSRFSTALGIRPQSYQNYVGRQASQPSLDLVLNVCERFQIDPRWLLFGRGEPAMPGSPLKQEPPGAHALSLAQRLEVLETKVGAALIRIDRLELAIDQ